MPAAEYPANVSSEEEPHPTLGDSSSSLINYHIIKKHHHSHLTLHISPADTPPNTIAPSYTTTPLSFLHLPAVPPSFDLLLANNSESHNLTSIDEIKAATRANLTFHPHIHGVEIKIEFLSQTDIPPSLGASTSPPPLPFAICKSTWTNRTYEFELPGGSRCVWKGTTTYKDALLDISQPSTASTTETRSDVNDGTTSGRGNLKLLDPCGKLVAVWRNMTDSEVLGVLTVDTSGSIGAALEVKLEECVATCVAVVMVERLQYKGRIGGLGKKEKGKE